MHNNEWTFIHNKTYLLTSTSTATLPFAHLLSFLLKSNVKLLLHNSTIAAAMNENGPKKFKNFFSVLCVSIIIMAYCLHPEL